MKIQRISVVGSCNVGGIAESLKHIYPDADVKCYHLGVFPKISDDDLISDLRQADFVITQVASFDVGIPFSMGHLQSLNIPFIYIPVVVFSGFFPDNTYILDGQTVLSGVGADFHSIIVAASFLNETPVKQVPKLFNKFTFSVLGYFETVSHSKERLLTNFSQSRLKIDNVFDEWIRDKKKFMYAMNHPSILTLFDCTVVALMEYGYLRNRVQIPPDIYDYLESTFNYPIYPSIAEVWGMEGGTLHKLNTYFVASGESRDLPLEKYCQLSYERYVDITKALENSREIREAAKKLKRHLV